MTRDAETRDAEVERDRRLVRRLQAYTELRFAAMDILEWWEDATACTPEEGAERWGRLRAAVQLPDPLHIDGQVSDDLTHKGAPTAAGPQDSESQQSDGDELAHPAETRVFDDRTTTDDMRVWHDADSPGCAWSVWQLGPPGFRCPTCGWACLDPDWVAHLDGSEGTDG